MCPSPMLSVVHFLYWFDFCEDRHWSESKINRFAVLMRGALVVIVIVLQHHLHVYS